MRNQCILVPFFVEEKRSLHNDKWINLLWQ